jgi:hypothetical protein
LANKKHRNIPEESFFVDADTTINPRVVASALQWMDKGVAGGGAPARFEGDAPLYAHSLLWWLGLGMRLAEIAGGAFMFCTRDAFQAVGGFDEQFFGAEDATMSWALKREGRFVVLWKYVFTSGRRARGVKGLQMLSSLIGMAFSPGMLKRRSSVKKIWYESNREDNRKIFGVLADQVCNAILLLITIVMITDPLFDHIPWLQTHSPTKPLVQFSWSTISCRDVFIAVSFEVWVVEVFDSHSIRLQGGPSTSLE